MKSKVKSSVVNIKEKSSRLEFKFKAKIWVWPGDMPWHFVSLDQEISKEIRDKYPRSSMVKVEATLTSSLCDDVNVADFNRCTETKWSTSLFRNNRDRNYLLPTRKDVRKKSGVQKGEVVEVVINIL